MRLGYSQTQGATWVSAQGRPQGTQGRPQGTQETLYSLTGHGVCRVAQAAHSPVWTLCSSPSTSAAGTSTSIPQFPAKAISSRQVMRPPSLTSWPEQRRRSGGGRGKKLSNLRGQARPCSWVECMCENVGTHMEPERRATAPSCLPSHAQLGKAASAGHTYHLHQGLTHRAAAPG